MVYPTSPRRPSPLPKLALLAIILVLLYGGYRLIFGGDSASQQAGFTPPPPAVTVKDIAVEDIPLVFEYPARLAGSREVEIRARVGGILQKRAYTEGQFVKRGDLLFVIDPAPYQAALAQAKANFVQADADYRRAVTLKRQRALSAREFDQAQALFGAAKAQFDTAKINLNYTTVRAPISGYTSEESFSEGTLVTADQTLLTRVTQLNPIYVEFAYPDSEAMLQRRSVANGSMSLPEDKLLRVEIVTGSGTVLDREGTIRFTDSIINTETGTVRARAIVPNEDQSIMPGQFVRVRVKGLTQLQSIGIPERAIMQGPMGTFVYTVTPEGNAAITPVELGLLNAGTQIITTGLKAGDRVITEGMIKVKPEAPVCVDTGGDDSPCNPANAGKAPAPKAEEKPKAEEAPAAEEAEEKPADADAKE